MKARAPLRSWKAAFGRPLRFRLKRRNGRKNGLPPRERKLGDKLVTLIGIVNQLQVPVKRAPLVLGPVA
jgi:hypothetical protein